MNRRTGILALFTLGASLLSGNVYADVGVSQGDPNTAAEYSLSSTTVNFGDPVADHFNFDFDAPNQSSVKLTAISVTYNFQLPEGAVYPDPQPTGSFLSLNGDLQYGLNEKLGTGFLLTVPKDGGNATVTVTKRPLTDDMADRLLNDLMDDPNNVVTTEFQQGGDFSSFFGATGAGGEGSSVTAQMTLYYQADQDTRGDGGGDTPEPASMLIWGAAVCAYAARRRITA
jgi:hypothetical protein